MQERIDIQDANGAVISNAEKIVADQEKQGEEEEAILAEQRRLNEQRIAQQQLLEERRKEQLEKLNSQIQMRIENTLKRDFEEKLEQETGLASSLNQDKENFLPGRVPKLMKRRKVRRRRPKPSKETSESPFTKFGNGQSRFGFGG